MDGIYGYNTQQAVKKMQQDYNDNPETGWIAEDGIFGPGTFNALMPEFKNRSGQKY